MPHCEACGEKISERDLDAILSGSRMDDPNKDWHRCNKIKESFVYGILMPVPAFHHDGECYDKIHRPWMVRE